MARLRAHCWPGNLRELRKTLGRLVRSRDPGDHRPVLASELVLGSRSAAESATPVAPVVAVVAQSREPAPATLSAPAGTKPRVVLTLEAVGAALSASNGNVKQAAQALGVKRQSLHRALVRRGHSGNPVARGRSSSAPAEA